MRKGKILKKAVVLLTAVLLISTFAVTANTVKNSTPIALSTSHEGSGSGARGDIVWDNGMDYSGLGAAQKDDQYPLYAECADDFQFEEDTEVCDVHWVGGYWNDATYNQVHWPWDITFYEDDGSGEKPGAVYLGPFQFDDTEYTETLIEDTGTSIYYEFSVDLDENYIFYGGHKYWIAIQGVGYFPPQSGWGLHEDPITLHEAVFRSEVLGFPDWTDSYDVFGYSADMCFQLTTKTSAAPAICCDGVNLDFGEQAPGTTVTGQIYVCNCGDPGSFLDWYVDETNLPPWGIWSFSPASGVGLAEGDCETVDVTCELTDVIGSYTGTIYVYNADDTTDFCDVPTSAVVKKSKAVNNWLFLRILEHFPMLKNLLGL